jgi:copper(I)-binding protein
MVSSHRALRDIDAPRTPGTLHDSVVYPDAGTKLEVKPHVELPGIRRLQRLAAVLLAAGSWPAATGHDFHAGAIGVDQARAAPAVAGQKEEPAFMTLTNSGKDDVLVGATCPVASSVELRAAIPVEGGTQVRTLEFKARGYHLAFISLGYSFAPGERIAATLRFASGLELPVEFQVQRDSAGEARADQK